MATYTRELEKFSVGQANGDSPVFGGMYEFCRRYTGEWKKYNFLFKFFFSGGSLSAACHMNQGLSDVTVNWAGGLHHSKKAEASGFCYVNDIAVGKWVKIHIFVNQSFQNIESENPHDYTKPYNMDSQYRRNGD